MRKYIKMEDKKIKTMGDVLQEHNDYWNNQDLTDEEKDKRTTDELISMALILIILVIFSLIIIKIYT